ncbi:hypothetical protein jhhlp_005998 [Lomentospora prolificans]|uniref:HAUS augmin-like complex subunit 6 N-terminal domain-containing protein n=1 Tax=Lomentospora prolificans TaxID=41688 RepID=A0A2N3N4P0_9PEZI|nr:hypothetical protein jhhlp_005998 [Lomentospora prolificans]
MASATSSSAIGRGRAGRLPANPAKNGAAPPHTSRGLVVPPASSALAPGASGLGMNTLPSSTLGNVAPVSNIELFLANLRILDLDLLPDWPDISVQTFASSTASQGQKRRVQAVEWALYYLFSLWDVEEAQTKLEPFFPPADQVQSLNLRAALLKSLDQVKKNGFLGRDTVIRKTMLDECKGDRLAEVLAAFSFAVVRKVVSDRCEETGEYPALAQTLALENRGYAGERSELAILKLAHQASLSKLLRKKNESRAIFDDFSELLDVKERGLSRKKELVKSIDAQEHSHAVSEAEKLEIWRIVRNNWAGNDRWMESLLHGDANSRRDGLLNTPFDKVWRRVQAGRLSELDDRGTGLVEQLEGRVRFQRERLQKWRSFQNSLAGDVAVTSAHISDRSSELSKGLGLQLNAHQTLHLGRMSPQKRSKPLDTSELSPEYFQLIRSLEKELTSAGKPPKKPLSELIPKPTAIPFDRLSTGEPSEPEVVSELEEAEVELSKPVEAPPPVVTRLPQRKPSHHTRWSRKVADEELPRAEPPSKDPEQSRSRRDLKLPKAQSIVTAEDDPAPAPASPTREQPRLNRSPTRDLIAREAAKVRRPDSHPPIPVTVPIERFEPQRQHEHPEPEQGQLEPPKSPTQQEADDILASINNASPSPVKQARPRHTLSLAERTRLSMARMSRSNQLSDDEEDLEETLSLHRPKPKPAPEPIREDAFDENEDLVARTRRSMAGFEAARQRAQLERRRSQRQSRAPARREGSYFPKLAEEDGQDDTSILAAELMEGEQNYEDVFMSRPKIKTSPLPSPTKEWSNVDE